MSSSGELAGYYEKGVSYLHAALPRAAKRIYRCDSSKPGKEFAHHVFMVEYVDAILCDQPMPEEFLKRIGRNRAPV